MNLVIFLQLFGRWVKVYGLGTGMCWEGWWVEVYGLGTGMCWEGWGQTNLISGSTDPTDPVFAESRKNIKNGPKIFICM